jgi:hypothetical protein
MHCAAGIVAVNQSCVKYFPDINAYCVYFDHVVEASDIEVERFTELVQTFRASIVQTFRASIVTDWCETFWTGCSDRMCPAHRLYSGCNKDMGVSWGSSRKFYSCLSSWVCSLAICAPLRQDSIQRGAREAPLCLCTKFVHLPTRRHEGYVVWSAGSAFKDPQRLLRCRWNAEQRLQFPGCHDQGAGIRGPSDSPTSQARHLSREPHAGGSRHAA